MTLPAHAAADFLQRLEALMERANAPTNEIETALDRMEDRAALQIFLANRASAIAQLVRAAENHAHVDAGCDLLNALAALNTEE